jgi:hypothetical protein
MTDVGPHEQARRPSGWVTCLKCGAKTRRGTTCAAPALQGKQRCRLHGGWSTGPRTPAGLRRLTLINLDHGRRSKWFRAALRAAGVAATGIQAELIAAELRLQGLTPNEDAAPDDSGGSATVG